MEPSRCRQLMSLDYPRVYLGKKCPFLLKVSSTPPPNVKVKKEIIRDFCSLCLDITGLTTHFISHPRHEGHLRSLLRVESSVLAFCSVCRTAVTRMLDLMDEVGDIECRIRTVVNLRQQSLTGKKEPRVPASINDKLTSSRIPIALVCKRETEPDIDIEYEDCIIKSEPWDPSEEAVALGSSRPLSRITEAAVTIPGGDGFPRPGHVHNNVATLPQIRSIKDEGGKTLFLCPAPSCGRKCTYKGNLFDHMSRIHGLQKSGFRDGNSRHGKKVHVQKSRARRKFCKVCKRGFNCPDLFKAHTHPDKGNPNKVSYSCPLCHKLFRTLAGFRYHQNLTHNDNGLVANKPTRCYFCSKVSLNAKVHVRHIRIHTLERPRNLFDHMSRIHRLQKSRNRRKFCKVCKRGFNCSNLFKAHTHPDKENPTRVSYSCPLCHKLFSTVTGFRYHQNVNHNGLVVNRPFRCYFCSKMSQNATVHDGHVRTHTLERPFSCGQCGREFAARSSLKRHMGTACGSDERIREDIRRRAREYMKRHRAKFQVRCQLCHKRFKRTEALMMHKRREHNDFL